MNDIQIFKNQEFGEIRILEIFNEPYFVGSDVAKVLGYTNPRKAIADHVDEEDRGVTKCDTLGGTQQMTIINESGLYSLVISSKLESAKKFKRWVTSEVLPTIRKHGMYATDELLDNPDLIIKMATALKEEREAKRLLERENKAKSEQILLMQDTIKTMEKKVSYLDHIFACPSTVKVKVIAQDYGMSAIAFNQLLHSMGIQYRDGKNWILYRRYLDKGYVKDVPFEYERRDGTKAVKSNTQWTQKGRAFLYEFLKSNLILPLIEQ